MRIFLEKYKLMHLIFIKDDKPNIKKGCQNKGVNKDIEQTQRQKDKQSYVQSLLSNVQSCWGRDAPYHAQDKETYKLYFCSEIKWIVLCFLCSLHTLQPGQNPNELHSETCVP